MTVYSNAFSQIVDTCVVYHQPVVQAFGFDLIGGIPASEMAVDFNMRSVMTWPARVVRINPALSLIHI